MGIAIGLDFGTTNSIVTYEDKKGKLRTFKQNGSPLIPSAIYFKSRDDYLIGTKALNMREKNFAALVTGFKTRLNEDNAPYELTLEDGSTFKINPKRVVSLFLNELMRNVQDNLSVKSNAADFVIDRAVITVPTKFNDRAKNAIKIAAAQAMNLRTGQVKLVYEPTAAAVAAQTDEEPDASRLLIYDFGGGTFDVSLIQKYHGIFKHIKTDGDPECGGNLLTKILAEKLLEWANEEYGTNFPWEFDAFDEDDCGISELKYKANISAIVKAADAVKISLSEETEQTAAFPFWTSEERREDYIVDVSRKTFENLIRKKINRTAEITVRVADSPEAKSVGGIDKIIIAGGSGQIPMIGDVLKDKLGELPISQSDDVSTLISRGAAILAQDIEQLEKRTEQKTVVELGISATQGVGYGVFQKIVDEGLTLPCEGSCDFKLLKDGQRSLKIAYLERDVKNFPKAARIDDEGISLVDELEIELPPDLKKADTIVKVTFAVQKDSVLEFSAKVLSGDGREVGSGKIKINKASDLF